MNLLNAVPTSLPPAERARLALDLETYRRELPRLLREGAGGRFAVVRQGRVVGVWDSVDEALAAAGERYGMDPVAVYRVNPLDPERFARLEAAPSRVEAPCPR